MHRDLMDELRLPAGIAASESRSWRHIVLITFAATLVFAVEGPAAQDASRHFGASAQLLAQAAATVANPRLLEAGSFDYQRIVNHATLANALPEDLAVIADSGQGRVLTFHPAGDKPWFIETNQTIGSPGASWRFTIRGHPNGDFLAKGFVLEGGCPTLVYERNIIGREGWYSESISLARFVGKTVKLRLEGHATGWQFEHAGLNSFFVAGNTTFTGRTTSAPVRDAPGDFLDPTCLVDHASAANARPEDLKRIADTGTGAVRTFHPEPAGPWMVAETVTLPATESTWVFSIRGHPEGDFLARGFVVDQNGLSTRIYERTIVGRHGWYEESIDLKSFTGKTVTLRLEGHATGWHFEHAGLDYFYVLKRPTTAPLTATAVSNWNGQIDKHIKRIAAYQPTYLYETNGLLANISAVVLASRRKAYDETYFSSLDYRNLAVNRLVKARQFLRAGNSKATDNSVKDALRFEALMLKSSEAATAIYQRGIDEAEPLVRGVYVASKLIAICGAKAVSPTATKAFEFLFDASDFALTWAIEGSGAAVTREGAEQIASLVARQIGIRDPCMVASAKVLNDLNNDALAKKVVSVVTSRGFREGVTAVLVSSFPGAFAAKPEQTARAVEIFLQRLAGNTKAAVPLERLPTIDNQAQAAAKSYALSRLAADAYKPQGRVTVSGANGEETWELLSTPRIVNPTPWGSLIALTYVNAASKTCAIVFAGTNDIVDVLTDAAQFMGITTADFENGARFAQEAAVKDRCRDSSKVIVGHSLGGAIAQYAFLKTDSTHDTYVFNPAGLAPTNPNFQVASFKGSDKVTCLVSRGIHPLTGDAIGQDVVHWTGVTLAKKCIGVPVYTWSPTSHFIDVLAEGLGIQFDYCMESQACRSALVLK